MSESSFWSDAELACAARAYLDMLHAELRGERYSKAEFNQRLREGPLVGRTKGSIEFRMQNISAALYELRMPHIRGYLPAKNIGTVVKEKLIAILMSNGADALTSFVPTSDAELLEVRVAELRRRKLPDIPAGSVSPQSTTSTVTTYIRDPAVKSWVLEAAKGICEGCSSPAPFVGRDGFPFLEVHHVTPLANHGSDTITNAVALCPNCHRRCHLALDRDEYRLELYQRIPRLVLEVSVA